MNKECDIIRDLLPLYLDDVCSDASREFVKNHLEVCESCKKEFEIMSAVDNEKSNKIDEKKALKKFSRKMRKKTVARALSLTLAVLVMFGGGYQVIYANENVIPYEKGLVSVEIPVDKGLDIGINDGNYKRGYSHFLKNDDGTYDAYINATSSIATKIIKDKDEQHNCIRISESGLAVDYKSGVGATNSDFGISITQNGEAFETEKNENDVSYSLKDDDNSDMITEKVVTVDIPDDDMSDFNASNIARVYYYDGDLDDVYNKTKDELKENGLHLVWERSKNK